jgi:hypothetical protein
LRATEPGRRIKRFLTLETRMRLPTHLLKAATFRSEPVLAAMAAVAVGMFLGTWVLGPAITGNKPDTPAQTQPERTSFQDLVARPDPMPYRAATPAFALSGTPNYGAAAREKARAEVGGRVVDDQMVSEAAIPEPPRDDRSSYSSSRNYRSYDRHRVY